MFKKILNNIKIILTIFVTVILIIMKSFIEFIYTMFTISYINFMKQVLSCEKDVMTLNRYIKQGNTARTIFQRIWKILEIVYLLEILWHEHNLETIFSNHVNTNGNHHPI